MRITIIDYDAGNQTSVQRALAHLGQAAEITADPDRVVAADRIIFPGVGAAGTCMGNLKGRGMDQALRAAIAVGKPVLSICVGLQLLFEASEEDGGTTCLGLVPGQVVRFRSTDPAIKIPHMGWNQVAWTPDEPIAHSIPPQAEFYFVHSYHPMPGPSVATICTADHGGRFCAGIRAGNLVAVQFHPEKSGRFGLQLLGNFLTSG